MSESIGELSKERTLVMSEWMLRALLYSHLLAHPAIVLAEDYREIEEIRYDKKTKRVTFVFSKGGEK